MTTRTSRLLDRLAVVFLTGLYFAAAAIDSVRRAWPARSRASAKKGTSR